MKRMQIALLVLLVFSGSVDAEDGTERRQDVIEDPVAVRIVTENCDESLTNVLQEVIKHYVDLGDMNSVAVLVQLAKNAHLTIPSRLQQTLHRVPGETEQMNEVFRYWGLGSF